MSTSHSTPIYDAVSRAFRRRRNSRLFSALAQIASDLGRSVRVLDVGGVETFWIASGATDCFELTLLNTDRALAQPYWFPGVLIAERLAGSALDLAAWRGHVDFVVCNSVIEHVGRWNDMERCAAELRAVAPAGWVQTPAFGFPIEPHFALPFIHWLAEPIRARLLGVLPHHSGTIVREPDNGRRAVEENNLLTHREFRWLFPDASVRRERILGVTKSFVAEWGLPPAIQPSESFEQLQREGQ